MRCCFPTCTACSGDYTPTTTSVTIPSGQTVSSVSSLSANDNNIRSALTAVDVSMAFPYDPKVGFHVVAVDPTTLRVNIEDNDSE